MRDCSQFGHANLKLETSKNLQILRPGGEGEEIGQCGPLWGHDGLIFGARTAWVAAFPVMQSHYPPPSSQTQLEQFF